MPTLAPLTAVPAAPPDFSEGEARAWGELGAAAIAAGCLSGADLVLLESCSILLASLRRLRRDPEVKPSMLTSAARELHSALRQLGITPASRGTVEPLPAPKPARDRESDPLGD